MKHKITFNQRGFTLLELLIVIVLVGLVATIAVAALGSARKKGQDTGIQANLANIRPNAESVHLEDGHYNRVCGVHGDSQETVITQMITAAEAESPAGIGSATCGASASPNAQSWAVSVQLATNGYWCVDNSGFSNRTENGLDHDNDVSCE